MTELRRLVADKVGHDVSSRDVNRASAGATRVGTTTTGRSRPVVVGGGGDTTTARETIAFVVIPFGFSNEPVRRADGRSAVFGGNFFVFPSPDPVEMALLLTGGLASNDATKFSVYLVKSVTT